MRRRIWVQIFVVLAVLEAVAFAAPAGPCRRIVSTSPSITESLFALGLGERVVGATKYCSYPPAARKIARIGGYVDPSMESIIRLRPDLVIMDEHRPEEINRLRRLNVKVLTIKQMSLSDIMETLHAIGRYCGVPERAAAVTGEIERRIGRVQRKVAKSPRPRVLVCIGMGGQPLDKVYVAGKKSFYHDLIVLAGGENACSDGALHMPAFTAEGLIKLNPGVVIDLVPESDAYSSDPAKEYAQWKKLDRIEAVRKRRVYVLTQDYLNIPGPRVINILEDIAKAIHPEVDWSRP